MSVSSHIFTLINVQLFKKSTLFTGALKTAPNAVSIGEFYQSWYRLYISNPKIQNLKCSKSETF
jgi:hypothetical protein